MIYFLDTSVFLAEKSSLFDNIYISPLVLMELEDIKNNQNKNEHIKYLARQAVRDIICNNNIKVVQFSQKKIDKLLKKYNFLININDHRILCEALLLAESAAESIKFVTCDAALYLFARNFTKLNAMYIEEEKITEQSTYYGWSKYYPTEEQMARLYSEPQINILGAHTNEFVEIFEGTELKDVLFWNGEKYRPLYYKEIKNSYLNETIRPRNLEQKMAFDLLQNRDISVKMLFGNVGVGKDFLMLINALDLIRRGEIERIIFIRNLVPFKDAPEIGFLSGSLQDKISWGLGPLMSILGEEGLKMAQEDGTIEAVNLGFIRGCSWDNSILYVSEGQNITGGGYKLLVSRCGHNSELWINGDIIQTDSKYFEKNNGLLRVNNSLKGNKLYGAVKLLKTERSKTAELASII